MCIFTNCISHGKQTRSPKSNYPPTSRKAVANRQSWTGCSVAGDSFGSLLVGLGGDAVVVGMAIAIRGSDGDRLARISEIGRHGLGDVADRANLHDRRLRLLKHELFVNRADLGLFFVGLLAASSLFFRCSYGNVVLKEIGRADV